MKIVISVICILMLCLSWMGCHREKRTTAQIPVDEITLDRQKVAGRFIKESEVTLEPGEYTIMPVRTDTSIFLRYRQSRNLILLKQYNFDLSLKKSHTFIEGKGPGEWIGTPEFVGYDNTLLMIDPTEDRISWFDDKMNIVTTLRHKYNSSFGVVYSELIKERNGEFGLYYYATSPARMKQGYYSGDDIKIIGGKIDKKGVDCEVYYETFKGNRKTKDPVYEIGEKIIFAQAGDRLYIINAEMYTVTSMRLDGVPLRSVQIRTERPVFSEVILQKWVKGYLSQKGEEHAKKWAPTWLYPSPLWPVAGVLPLDRGLAVITCENYDPENKPDMLRADYFDLDLNPLGVVYLPAYPFWNSPLRWHTQKARGLLLFQKGQLFQVNFDIEDEKLPTLSRWRLE